MAAKRNIKAMLKVTENLDSVRTLAWWRFWSDLGENVGDVGFVDGCGGFNIVFPRKVILR